MSTVMPYHDDCLFCKIMRGTVPSEKVYADSFCYAFRDIHPLAPTHILVIPRAHLTSVNDVNRENGDLIGHVFTAISKIAKKEGIADKGYRVISNCGAEAGQTVPHLHFHILAGVPMAEKML